MWTHLQPYLIDDGTARSIRRNARVGLWRALNLRRLVVMAGSGVTRGREMPSWEALAVYFLAATKRQFDEVRSRRSAFQRFEHSDLVREINRLSGADMTGAEDGALVTPSEGEVKKVGDITLIMDLCEKLLERLPDSPAGVSRAQLARIEFAQAFRKDRAKRGRDRLANILGQGNADWADPAALTDGCDLLENLRRVACGEKPIGNGTSPELEPDRDVVEAVVGTLGSARVLTLNYDVEFERWVGEQLKLVKEGDGPEETSESPGFRALLRQGEAQSDAPGRPIEPIVSVASGVRKAALSATLRPDNVGELINFAAYSRRFDHQVFHLHGRLDDPAHMVLTQEDYRRVYLQEPASQQSFEAAQDILFTGNDVLFMGVGMREDEVLRPLRRFVSRERPPDGAPGRTFVLLPTRYGKAFEDMENEKTALRLSLHYGASTLFYGGKRFRALMQGLDEIDAAFRKKGAKKKLLEDVLAKLKERGGAFAAGAEAGAAVLLDERELTALTETVGGVLQGALGSPNAGGVRLRAAVALVEEVKSRVHSRALVHELGALKRDAEQWWDDWRRAPHERRARYHLVHKSLVAGKDEPGDEGSSDYLWVRHCPDYAAPDVDWDWRPIEAARRAASESDPGEDKRRRILRLAAPRGGGKGSLISLLLRKSIHSKLFAGQGAPVAYQAGFVAHLSFSMEFNSVLKALSRFVARRVAQLQIADVDGSRQAARALAALADEEGGRPYRSGLEPRERDLVAAARDGGEAALGVARIERELAGEGQSRLEPGVMRKRLRLLTAKQRARHGDLIGAIERAADGKTGSAADGDKGSKADGGWLDAIGVERDRLWALAKDLYVQRREDEPRLIALPGAPSDADLEKEASRRHRLDILRLSLRVYQELSEGDPSERLFICLSGLDRVADERGDGHNPAHRALFRLLAGREERETSDRLDPPYDLVLIAGRPDAPICYLSEEPASPDAVAAGDRQDYSTLSLTQRMLKKWRLLPPLGWIERAGLTAIKVGPLRELEAEVRSILGGRRALKTGSADPRTRLIEFLVWALETDSAARARPLDERHSTVEIHRLLWENVALTIWVATLWARWPETREGVKPPSFRDYVEQLDRTAGRRDFGGVLDAVLDSYRRVDKLNDSPLDATLVDLILRHLTIFALPVEPWVLLGAPLIYRRLKRLYPHEPEFGDATGERLRRLRALADWHERRWMLAKLCETLRVLCERSLAIRVHSPHDADERVQGGSRENGCEEQDLHFRYSVHARLREHLAYKMRLAVRDGGDTNHHRMSIYCDQPRDLPTPSAEHYAMVREIMDEAIARCRETLEATYRNSRVGHFSRRSGWDDFDEAPGESDPKAPSTAMDRAAAERVFAPGACDPSEPAERTFFASLGIKTEDEFDDCFAPSGLGGAFGRLHAAPQRLRAGLSLLQGTFSLGSLSRLDNVERALGDNSPYDAYRTWLRSLLNAATGLERNRRELDDVLGGLLLAHVKFDKKPPSTSFTDVKTVADLSQHAQAIIEFTGEPRDGEDDERGVLARNERRVIRGGRALGFTRAQKARYNVLRHPFYRDEIAWLYNERGLTSLVQGHLFDALPLLRKAQFIMSHARTPEEDSHAFHAAERRIRLNHAIAEIERGNLASARGMLQELRASSADLRRSTPSQIRHFVILYQALCDHLSGSLQRAIVGYDAALDEFVKRQQLRAVAIANRHYGDLMASRSDFGEAERRFGYAMSAASQAEQRDELNLAMTSYARLMIDLEKFERARGYIDRVKAYAGAMGLGRLQADGLIAEGRLMLARGEFAAAGQSASQAVAIAVRGGLRLRKIGGLVLLAETRRGIGSTDLARSILEDAKSEAERLGYQTQAARAGEILSTLATAAGG